VALGPKSIARHLTYIRALGVESRLAAERPLMLSVAQSEEEGDAGLGCGIVALMLFALLELNRVGAGEWGSEHSK